MRLPNPARRIGTKTKGRSQSRPVVVSKGVRTGRSTVGRSLTASTASTRAAAITWVRKASGPADSSRKRAK